MPAALAPADGDVRIPSMLRIIIALPAPETSIMLITPSLSARKLGRMRPGTEAAPMSAI